MERETVREMIREMDWEMVWGMVREMDRATVHLQARLSRQLLNHQRAVAATKTKPSQSGG